MGAEMIFEDIKCRAWPGRHVQSKSKCQWKSKGMGKPKQA